MTPVPPEYAEACARQREKLIEKVAEVDHQLMISYVEGRAVSATELKKALRRATLGSAATPVLCGSALRNKGIQPLLDAVVDYLPAPDDVLPVSGSNPKTGEAQERRADDAAPFASLAFKIVADPYVGRLAYFRVYSGKAATGSTVFNSTRGERERFGRLLRMHANHREEIEEVYAGDIAAAVGLKNTFTGDTLSDLSHQILLESIRFPEPVIAVAIEPKTKEDQDRMSETLNRLAEEDPTFRIRYDQETGQTIISGMGELHLEVIVDRMLREFRVGANVGRPQVAYKETITRPVQVEGRFVRQTGGRGQYGARLAGVRASGAAAPASSSSRRSWGQSSPASSSARRGAGRARRRWTAAPWPAIRSSTCGPPWWTAATTPSTPRRSPSGRRAPWPRTRRWRRAIPILLEPVMKIEAATPEQFFGDVVGDITSRRGHVMGVDARGSTQIVRALVPLAETFGYATDLRSLTQGRATYSMEFDHYEEVPAPLAEKIGGGRVRRPTPA